MILKVNVTTGRPKMTGGELSSLIWTKRVEILGDRSDRWKERFHLNALIFELEKHKVFDDEVETENFWEFCVLLKHYKGEVEVEIKYTAYMR